MREHSFVTEGTTNIRRRVGPAAIFGGYALACAGVLALVLAVHDGTNAERGIAVAAVCVGLVAGAIYLRKRGAWDLDRPGLAQRERRSVAPLVGVAVLLVAVTNAAGTAVTAACLGVVVGAWLALVALLTVLLIRNGAER
jgi:hypothetical protein